MPEFITFVVGATALVAAAVGGLYLWPLGHRKLRLAPAAPLDFAAATAAAQSITAAEAEDPQVRPQSRSRLLSHGARTARAVLLLHGYTMAPEQYDTLADVFFSRGYNVWIPRAPHHGTVDRRAHHRVEAAELTAYADEAVTIAAGLGDEVGVVGISGGAVLATWLAQARGDVVRRLLVLSPFFGPHQGPAFAVRPLITLYGRRVLRDRVTARGYSLAAVTRYLMIVRTLPRRPRRTGLVGAAVVVSPLDTVVDAVAAVRVPRRIAHVNGVDLRVYALPESLGVRHNTLDLAGLGGGAADVLRRYADLYEGDPTTASDAATTING